MPGKKNDDRPQVVGLFGIGLDSKDGHKRITRGEEFLVIGGSQETHAKMQDVVMHCSETLRGRGKRLKDAPK